MKTFPKCDPCHKVTSWHCLEQTKQTTIAASFVYLKNNPKAKRPPRERHSKISSYVLLYHGWLESSKINGNYLCERFCSDLVRKKSSLNCSTMKLEISQVRNKLITETNTIVFFKSKWLEVGGWQFPIKEGKRSPRGTCCWKCTYGLLFFSTSVIRSLHT